jgi:hypothetical protein
MLPRFDNKTRAKYAIIRLRNVLKRYPAAIMRKDPVIMLLTQVSEDLWDSVKELTPTDEDIEGIETAADHLERALDILDDK